METTKLMAAIIKYLDAGQNDMALLTARAHGLAEWLEYVRSIRSY